MNDQDADVILDQQIRNDITKRMRSGDQSIRYSACDDNDRIITFASHLGTLAHYVTKEQALALAQAILFEEQGLEQMTYDVQETENGKRVIPLGPEEHP